MANSDIIKIGFDYRASLAQFEKETNGVFDGISTKAGKQKITIQLDAKDDKVIDKIKELQKLKLDKFTFEFGDSGLKEQLQTFDKLENKINEIINLGKGIGSAINGAGNSIVDEKYLKTVIDLFSKIENHTSTIKKAFSDVGDGEELSPLLKTISNIESAIDKLSSSVKGIGLNMNIDIGSDKEMEAKAQAKISNALQAYKNLFEHIKMSSAGGSIITQKFFDFDINQFDTPMSKLQAYIKFIKDMREETKQMFGGQDVLKTDTDAKYWTQASSAMGQVTKVFNEMKTASDVNPLENIFGKTDLSSVIEQLNTIVSKLDEISVSAKGFTEIFKNGLNINASVEEIEKLTNRVKELESELAKIKTPTAVTTPQESNISSGNKIDEVVSSAKDLDKTLEQVDIPTDSFDKILEKLDRSKSELVDIVKITRKSVPDAEGKFHNSYTLKDSRGSTEIYKMNSKTDKGKMSDQNIVEYNANVINKALEEEHRQRQKIVQAEEKQIQKNKELALSYTESTSKKLSNAISKYSYGDSSDATTMMKQMNRGLSNFGDLSNIESNIKNFDSVVDLIITDLKRSHEEALSSLNSEIKAEETIQKQKDAFNKSNLSAIDMEIQKREEEAKAFPNSLKAQMKARQQAESQISKFENNSSKYQAKTNNYDTTIARLEDGGWSSPEYLKNVQEVKDAVKEYDDLLNKIKTEQSGIASDEDIQKLKEYESKIKETIATVTNMSAAEKGYNAVSGQKELDKIHKILNENTKMSAKAQAQIKAFYKEIESGNPSMSLDKIHTEIMKIYNAEVEAGRAGKSMWSAIKEKAWYGMASAIGTYFGFNDIIQYGKEAFNVIKDLDTALVDLKKTTSMSATQLENFYYDSNDVAKQMGVTTQEIIEQASAWSRLGYSSKEESTEMAKLSSQFASISPGMSTDESQEGLVSIMKAFDIDPDNVKSEIMDKVNTLGNNFAEDNQDVVEGLKRSAAAMSAMGQSFTDTAALFTGGMEILQDSESMGTALRTLSMRVRGYDEETNQLSDDLVNVTGEVANLTKTTQDSQGVSLFTDATQEHYRSMVEYLGDIADRWDLISEKNQTELLQKLFGKNRANAGAAIIQNFDQVRAAIEAMDESAGSADKEMDTIENSLDYKLNALKETWVGIIQDMSDRGTLGGIINGLTGISDAIGGLFNGLQQISSLDGNISSLGGTLGTVVGLVQSLTGHGENVLRPSL